MPWILGIDTSAYTTSVAAVNIQGKLLGEERQLLNVPPGGRGLRQSEAVFQHVVNLPPLIEKLMRGMGPGDLAAAAASSRPRPLEGSYMPVFLVGLGTGRSLAAVQGIPFFPVSHQEGHLAAGISSTDGPLKDRFLAVHLSGGTSEILLVERTETGFSIDILGNTLDLHAGQLVDRVGVALGLPFPAGPPLEELAQQSGSDFTRLPSSVDGLNFSFSGVEAQAQRWIAEGAEPANIARAVEACLVNTLEKVILRGMEESGLNETLIVGGVASNRYLRRRLVEKLEHPSVGARLYFTSPQLSSDNAVGVAHLGLKNYNQSISFRRVVNDSKGD